MTTETIRPSDEHYPTAEYELQAPPGEVFQDQDRLRDCAMTAASLGMTEDQANAFLLAYATGQPLPDVLPAYQGTREQGEETLRVEWGTEYEARLALAQWVADECGERVLDALDTTGLGNDPCVIRFLAREGARAAQQWQARTPDHAYHDPASPDHAAAVERMQWWAEVAQRR